MENEVVIRYSSSRNISFHGELETGMTREEWEALSEEEQQEVYSELVWELVEMYPTVDGESI
jgi:hypothetical protein